MNTKVVSIINEHALNLNDNLCTDSFSIGHRSDSCTVKWDLYKIHRIDATVAVTVCRVLTAPGNQRQLHDFKLDRSLLIVT